METSLEASALWMPEFFLKMGCTKREIMRPLSLLSLGKLSDENSLRDVDKDCQK